MNRRIQKLTGSDDLASYLYDGLDVLQELSNDEDGNAEVVEYYRSKGKIVSRQVYGESETTRSLKAQDFYSYDAMGNVVALTDWEGWQKTRYQYDAFGELLAGDTSENEYTFGGQRLDPETGLYHYHFRQYDPVNGVWTTPDPIGVIGGVNLYQFVKNNPVNKKDWRGLVCGSGWSDKVVPDRIFPYDLTEICQHHDDCYTDQNGFAYCNEQLGKEIDALCGPYGFCKVISNVYETAVNLFGKGPYNAAAIIEKDLLNNNPNTSSLIDKITSGISSVISNSDPQFRKYLAVLVQQFQMLSLLLLTQYRVPLAMILMALITLMALMMAGEASKMMLVHTILAKQKAYARIKQNQEHDMEYHKHKLLQIMKYLISLFLFLSIVPYSFGRDYNSLFEDLTKISSSGDPVALYNLGMFYNNGLGTKKDRAKAFECFQKSAEGGDPLGNYKLGCYYAGQGKDVVAEDLQKAFEFKLVAAKAGYSLAQFDVGRYYIKIGNMDEAVLWLERSAAQGFPNAYALLFYVYYEDKLGIKDWEKAYKYLILAENSLDTKNQEIDEYKNKLIKILSKAQQERAKDAVNNFTPHMTLLTKRAFSSTNEIDELIKKYNKSLR